MAKYISVDTDELYNVASIAKQANDALTDAMFHLNQVTTHNDWSCTERFAINEHILNNRKMIVNLHDASENFYNVLHQVAQDFDTKEKEISTWFSSVDEELATVFDVSTSPVNRSSSSGRKHGGAEKSIDKNQTAISNFTDFISRTISSTSTDMAESQLGVKRIVDKISITKFSDFLGLF